MGADREPCRKAGRRVSHLTAGSGQMSGPSRPVTTEPTNWGTESLTIEKKSIPFVTRKKLKVCAVLFIWTPSPFSLIKDTRLRIAFLESPKLQPFQTALPYSTDAP